MYLSEKTFLYLSGFDTEGFNFCFIYTTVGEDDMFKDSIFKLSRQMSPNSQVKLFQIRVYLKGKRVEFFVQEYGLKDKNLNLVNINHYTPITKPVLKIDWSFLERTFTTNKTKNVFVLIDNGVYSPIFEEFLKSSAASSSMQIVRILQNTSTNGISSKLVNNKTTTWTFYDLRDLEIVGMSVLSGVVPGKSRLYFLKYSICLRDIITLKRTYTFLKP